MMAVVSSDCMYLCLFSVNYFNHQQSSLILYVVELLMHSVSLLIYCYFQLPDLLWILN